MRLRYTEQAQRHLAAIFDHIASDDPDAAAAVLSRIRATVQVLDPFPFLGHPGHISGTLELVVARLPYVVAYRVEIGDQDQVIVLGVFHMSRER